MAVESKMIPLGTKAPEFELPDTISGNLVNLYKIKSDIATVVMFLCNHCPYVIHIREVLATVANEYQKKGITFAGVSSNDIEKYPEDNPERMKEFAAEAGYSFPYLYDESQSVARAYDAACTPEFYVFNKNMQLVYRGQFDSARPGNKIPVTGEDLRNVLDTLIAGGQVSEEQKPSMGCSIKWKQ